MEKTMDNLEKDMLSRRKIVTEINRNFFVEAGAGSGKTTMLVNRMVAMVEAGIDISRICAITFTKAAANEFYERFQNLLILRSNPDYAGEDCTLPGSLPAPTAVTRERCSAALRNIDLCFMGTIDSFCGMVLSEHPSEAGIPSDSGIIEDEDAVGIYMQQYARISNGEYGPDLQVLAQAFQSVHKNAQEVFAQGIRFIMDNRNVRFHFPETAAGSMDAEFREERTELIRAVNCLADHPEIKSVGTQKSRAAWERIQDIRRVVCSSWDGNYVNLMYRLRDLADIRVIPEAMDRYGVSLGPFFEPGGKLGKWYECSIRKSAVMEKLKEYQYGISMTFLAACVPAMEQALRERGKLTFFDYLYDLRNMLRTDAEGSGRLIRYIYARHSYFLIDEFQDTNPLQAEIFFYLAAENPVPKWSDCVPRPGALFIVGDPKQSIYRFRGADVSSFMKVKRLFAAGGGEILGLSRNFRSVRTLCAYFNRVFEVLLPEETKEQSRFESIPLPEPEEDEFQGIFTYEAYTGKNAEKDHADRTDPVRIADIVERLVGNAHLLIREGAGGALRPLRYSDIMVITRYKPALDPITAELDRRDIPTRVEGSIPFSDNRALHEIALLYAAVTEADAYAIYGALTGEIIALTKEDILQYRFCGGKLSFTAPFDTESCEDRTALLVAEQIRILGDLHRLSGRLSPAALFSKILDQYRIYEVLPAENLEVVCYALELLRDAERSGEVVSLEGGAAFIRDLIDGKSGQERCLSLTDDRNCVHLANLHKVKGLEAPVVILAGARVSDHDVKTRIHHGDEGAEGYIFTLSQGYNATYFSTQNYVEEKEAEAAAQQDETQRLIYVAATRARNALIVCDSVENKEHNSFWQSLMEDGAPDIFEFTKDIWAGNDGREDREAGSIRVEAKDLYDAAAEGAALNNRAAQEPTFEVDNPSRLEVQAKRSGASGEDVGGSTKPDGFAALLGTMTHRLMEMLVTGRNRVEAGAAVAEILREEITPESEPIEEQLSECLLRVAEHIRSGGYAQTNGVPEDVLGTLLAADEVYCELPFCYREERGGGAVWNGIMDVVYSSGGKWHILDYKTNADGNDLDTRYRNQLEAYVRAFKATTGFDADAHTYHIDI